MADSPEMFLRLEETSGQHLDEAANNHDSTSVTSPRRAPPIRARAGRASGKGDDFDGTDDSSRFPTLPFGSRGRVSWSVMVACQIDAYDATFRRVVAHDDGATAGWCIGCETAIR
jgi:hypothetical protein